VRWPAGGSFAGGAEILAGPGRGSAVREVAVVPRVGADRMPAAGPAAAGTGRSGHPGAATARSRRPAQPARRTSVAPARRPAAYAAGPTSTAPWLSASYSAPCPRRCSGTRHSPTNDRTGPSAHSSASVSSNSSSARRFKHPYSSPRNLRSRSTPSAASASAGRVWPTPAGQVKTVHHGHRRSLEARNSEDHAVAALRPAPNPSMQLRRARRLSGKLSPASPGPGIGRRSPRWRRPGRTCR
jgi:hypothetical protein